MHAHQTLARCLLAARTPERAMGLLMTERQIYSTQMGALVCGAGFTYLWT